MPSFHQELDFEHYQLVLEENQGTSTGKSTAEEVKVEWNTKTRERNAVAEESNWVIVFSETRATFVLGGILSSQQAEI